VIQEDTSPRDEGTHPGLKAQYFTLTVALQRLLEPCGICELYGIYLQWDPYRSVDVWFVLAGTPDERVLLGSNYFTPNCTKKLEYN
ncbi:hypothetical protein Tco_0739931, partial [Tanacetum coccineum]